MALDQRSKGQLARLTAAGGELLEQLAVGERADGADVEERPKLFERIAAVLDRHGSSLPVGLPQISPVYAASGLARSRFLAHPTIFRPGPGGSGGRRTSFSALPLVLNRDTEVSPSSTPLRTTGRLER